MTQATDQFAELTRRGHEVFTAAIQAWDQAARSIAEAARRPEGRLPDIRASVDAAFDFAAQMLADQRDFTRTIMSVGSQVVAATAERAVPSAEPAATTGSDVRSAPEAGTPPVESHPRTAASEDSVSTRGPDDSAGTRTRKTQVPAPVARKAAARKTAAKKTAAPAKKNSPAKRAAGPRTGDTP
jgi:hypothetical protein